jgi:hypothetical protein
MNEGGPQLKNDRATKKARLLEELKTEPLKYALEIANVENAEELVEKLMQYDTNAQFEKVFEKLKNTGALKKIHIVFQPLPDQTTASYQASSQTLFIDTTYGNSAEIGSFYKTIIHELFHHVFKGADSASSYGPIYALLDIKNTIHKLPIHNKYRHLYKTVLSNVSKEDKEQYYGLSSTDEFISEAYSNPDFQSFLKTVELKTGKQFTHKMADLLLSVVTINTRIISKEITEKDAFTAFQNIDLDSLDLLEDFEKNMEESKKQA